MKIIKIDSCKECKHYKHLFTVSRDFCDYSKDYLYDRNIIPKWCKLEDYKTRNNE